MAQLQLNIETSVGADRHLQTAELSKLHHHHQCVVIDQCVRLISLQHVTAQVN